jgi:SAM-dependent methyltransferase
VDGDDKRDLVRRGYDALSYHYRSDDADDGRYALWLADLHQRLPISAAVLDLGCGCGVPVARFLANAGHRVTGVDISDVQIERARRLVPTGTFRRADATQIDLRLRRSTPVDCLYALIHMPVADQPRLIDRIAAWLRPGGWLLTTVGNAARSGTEDSWLGGPRHVVEPWSGRSSRTGLAAGSDVDGHAVVGGGELGLGEPAEHGRGHVGKDDMLRVKIVLVLA